MKKKKKSKNKRGRGNGEVSAHRPGGPPAEVEGNSVAGEDAAEEERTCLLIGLCEVPRWWLTELLRRFSTCAEPTPASRDREAEVTRMLGPPAGSWGLVVKWTHRRGRRRGVRRKRKRKRKDRRTAKDLQRGLIHSASVSTTVTT